MEHIGYKKLRHGLMCKLHILGENNETRSGIINKNYAKFRCSRATVLDIYDMFDINKKHTKGYSLEYSNFSYQVGQIVTPVNSYDIITDKVCTSGIHYFLTEDAAYWFLFDITNYSGECKNYSYTGNGLELPSTHYEDGYLV